MSVFVLAKNKKPLMPCSEKRARLLLSRGRAVVHLMVPFTIRLKGRTDGAIQPLHVKLDPGSKQTGMAVVLESKLDLKVLWLSVIHHRSHQISEQLTARRAMRRRRRNQLWYRPARFDNRTRPSGWLAPSLQHRVDTTLAWVKKLSKLAPVSDIGLERVKFDMQKMVNGDIAGAEYQQGTLFGFEVKEYLLAKHKHTCAYCNGVSGDNRLEVEHVQPRSKGGGNSVKNLVIACRSCNEAKGSQLLPEWKQSLGKSKLDKSRAIGIEKTIKGKWTGLRDAAAVNTTRNALLHELLLFAKDNVSVYTGTGAMTKFNRKQQGISKHHALDALCVGESLKPVKNWTKPVLEIKCTGRGSYQRTRLNKFGFPRGYLMRQKAVHGFQTGDQVKAVVPSGKKQGIYTGRVAVRASGSFNIQAANGLVQGISHKHCTLIQRGSGYGFNLTTIALTHGEREKQAA
ncbi:RNA-guided endonuclease IscB [Thiomicrospira microaerophila]|uniref:RNA-guided endonuclease IscB n=1 Tax=Thiomicrospira microaerophila TaxID=406020 RepID=UPI000A02A686|nr:RNA-guided endonuclease IscB [Thiomicrospira microaerophila]